MDWAVVKEFVKSYFFDTSTAPTTLYVEYETPGRDNVVISSSSMFETSNATDPKVASLSLKRLGYAVTHLIVFDAGNYFVWVFVCCLLQKSKQK